MAKSSGITLTDMTFIGRQSVKFGIIALVMLIVGRTALTTFIAVWKALNPPPPAPPTMGFGRLPQLRFPEQIAADKPETYTLELANGSFPPFKDRAKVFLMVEQQIGLLTDQRVKEVAASLNYVFEPEILSSRIYRWKKNSPLDSTLRIDSKTFQFKITSDFLSRPELLSPANLPEEAEATEMVKAFLNSAELLPIDVASASARVTYLKALGTEVLPAVSYSDADFAQVDLNRYPIDSNFRIFTPAGLQGVISAVIAGSLSRADNIVSLSYNYHAMAYGEVHTYPLRPVAEAWKIVQAGEAYIASKGEEDQAIIRDVILGYYDDFEEQEYLQPVYVFVGDNGFLAYVSALDPAVISVK
jgi:hypothetical protein